MPEDSSPQKEEGSAPVPVSFEGWADHVKTWAETLPEDVQKGVHEKVGALKGAYDSVRRENKSLQEKIAGMKSPEDIAALQEHVKHLERKGVFFERLPGEVNNPQAAWKLAQSDTELVKADGSLDMEAFSKAYPQLVGKPQGVDTHAGSGSGQQGGPKVISMDEAIRGGLLARR